MGIAVFGAVFVDIKGYPLAQYIPQGRNVGRVIQVHGGVSRNVAEDIANVGLHPTYVSVVDDTGIGLDVLDRLEKHGVDTRYVAKTKDGLGTWLAIFDNQGDVVASISKRPDLSKIEEILDEHGDEIIKNADSVVVEIDMEESLLHKIFSLAEKYGKSVFAVVTNMSIALERKDLLSKVGCVVCNAQEAGLLFTEDYGNASDEDFLNIVRRKVEEADISRMVITLGDRGAVYAEKGGESGYCPPQRVEVVDTAGAGDAFFAGVAIGLSYGKTLAESAEIGTRMASSVISVRESVIPHFKPGELGIIKP